LVEGPARAFSQPQAFEQAISLRLPQHILERIKTAANRRDVRYQSLIKILLEEKLKA